MKKILYSLVPLLILIGLAYGGYMYKQYSDFYSSLKKLDTASTTKQFMLNDINTHNATSSCYTMINSNVYDLTTWVGKHPGGPKRILDICGKDGTDKFGKKHGKDKKAKSVLDLFQIGITIPQK